MERFEDLTRLACHCPPIISILSALPCTTPETTLSLLTSWIAVQHTKEPLHAAYLITPSPETRNYQSLLSSFPT